MEQLDLYSFLPKFVINKKVRLIEAFAGIGFQNLALKYLGVDYEQYKIIEWDINAVIGYSSIHCRHDKNDYSKIYTVDQLNQILSKLGLSMDGKKPINYNQILRMNERKKRKLYNAIIKSKNLCDITRVKATDLEIKDTQNFVYLFFYSYPCQSISLAGTRGGMKKGTGTSSSMLWEIERILMECNQLPQILIMENVPAVIDKMNIDDFNTWKLTLEKLGYINYFQLLNAKDYGVPQNRNRAFMVSILGNYQYTFPKKEKLNLRLEDLLEKNVGLNFFITEKRFQCYMMKHSRFNRQQQFLRNFKDGVMRDIAATITTRSGDRAADNYIMILPDENNGILLPENTKKGYTVAYHGDGIYIDNLTRRRGVTQKNMIMTIKTVDDVGVVLKRECPFLKDKEVFMIRKLTAHEDMRLMGMRDIDYYYLRFNTDDDVYKKLLDEEINEYDLMEIEDLVEENMSFAAIKKQAGNGIVVNVIMAIIKEFYKEVNTDG